MYISAEEIEDYIQSPNPQLLRQVTQLVRTEFPGKTYGILIMEEHFQLLLWEQILIQVQDTKKLVCLIFLLKKIMLRSIFMEVMWLCRSDFQSQL